jgi:hypothetical protein
MDDVMDRFAIREVIDNWALWRDAGDWDRLATLWAKDSWISATWFHHTLPLPMADLPRKREPKAKVRPKKRG